jgi:hypothetical protein
MAQKTKRHFARIITLFIASVIEHQTELIVSFPIKLLDFCHLKRMISIKPKLIIPIHVIPLCSHTFRKLCEVNKSLNPTDA